MFCPRYTETRMDHTWMVLCVPLPWTESFCRLICSSTGPGKGQGQSTSIHVCRGPQPAPCRSTLNLPRPWPRANTTDSFPFTVHNLPVCSPWDRMEALANRIASFLTHLVKEDLLFILGSSLSAIFLNPSFAASQPVGKPSLLTQVCLNWPSAQSVWPSFPSLLLHLGPSPWLCFGESWKGWFPPPPLIIFRYLHQHFYFALLRHPALNSAFVWGRGESWHKDCWWWLDFIKCDGPGLDMQFVKLGAGGGGWGEGHKIP